MYINILKVVLRFLLKNTLYVIGFLIAFYLDGNETIGYMYNSIAFIIFFGLGVGKTLEVTFIFLKKLYNFAIIKIFNYNESIVGAFKNRVKSGINKINNSTNEKENYL